MSVVLGKYYTMPIHRCQRKLAHQCLTQLILKEKESISEYFDVLKKAAYSGKGLKNYYLALTHFTAYILRNVNLSPEQERMVQSLQRSVEGWKSGNNRQVSNDKRDKKFNEFINPIKLPNIKETHECYNALWPQCDRILDKYENLNKGKGVDDFVDPPNKDMKFIQRFLAIRFPIFHFQRPGVPQNLNMDEFASARCVGDHYIIPVKDHKTGATKPAMVALSKREYHALQKYTQYMRPRQGVNTDGKNTVFVSNAGGNFLQLSLQFSRFQEQEGLPKLTAGDMRKAMETECNKYYGKGTNESKMVADYLQHTEDVAKQHYVISDASKVVESVEIIYKIIKGNQAGQLDLDSSEEQEQSNVTRKSHSVNLLVVFRKDDLERNT